MNPVVSKPLTQLENAANDAIAKERFDRLMNFSVNQSFRQAEMRMERLNKQLKILSFQHHHNLSQYDVKQPPQRGIIINSET